MTLHTRQHTLPVDAVLLDRVVLVVERYVTILVRLAVFGEHDFLRLSLALFFLRDQAEGEEGQKQND